ncbi:MAG: hypothetical protein WCE64_04660 [Bacteroidales bacterium]
MISAYLRGYKRILRKFGSERILSKIGSGKVTYFENPAEGIAFKYIPGETGRPGRYYAKYYGQNGSEINFDSTSILVGVMEGKKISKSRYNRYQLIENVIRNRKINIDAMARTVNSTWVYV